MNKIFKHLAVSMLAVACCAGIQSCSRTQSMKVTGTTAKVTEVIDGQTIKLSNNLTVKLIGVEKNAETQKFLERNVKGKRVKLIAESGDPKQTYVKGNKETVKAYVNVVGDRMLSSVNGRMIRTKVSPLIKKEVKDSIDAFAVKERQKLTDAELMALLKPRTFLIIYPDGSLGTGFYISSNGMALSNAHVVNYSSAPYAMIVPFKDDGSFDPSNYRTIERVIEVGSEDNAATDYCIFEVSLNGEKVPFLELAEQQETDGNRVWKLGCVKGQPAQFSQGLLSHTLNGVVSHNAKTNQGDSGSPLVNQYGEVIGINQSIMVNERLGGDVGVNNAVDIQTLREWFENHRDDSGQLRYGR